MLAEKLNMSSEDAEKWIVNMIRNARLDAKIDSQLVSHIILRISSIQAYSKCGSAKTVSNCCHFTGSCSDGNTSCICVSASFR